VLLALLFHSFRRSAICASFIIARIELCIIKLSSSIAELAVALKRASSSYLRWLLFFIVSAIAEQVILVVI
jgi:hypothetical protein